MISKIQRAESFFLLSDLILDTYHFFVSLTGWFVQYEYLTLSLTSSHMQFNGDLLFTKIEESTVLIHNASRQVMLRAVIGR